jgi:hypothetical protein
LLTLRAPNAVRCHDRSWSAGRVRRVGCGGQCGRQSDEQDVEAAFEFGGAVVGGQDGGEAAQDGKFADRQPVQARAQ